MLLYMTFRVLFVDVDLQQSNLFTIPFEKFALLVARDYNYDNEGYPGFVYLTSRRRISQVASFR